MAGDPATPPPLRRRDLLVDACWVALLLAWAAGWCLTAADRLGPTYDETFYLQAGLQCWRSGTTTPVAVHGVMPLPIVAATAPLYLHERMSGEEVTAHLEHLGRARVVTLGWLLLLLVSVLRLGRAAGGPWAGRVAAGLIAADPTVLAHASLATTDISLAAALMALTRAAYVGRGGTTLARVVVPGFWYGVAVLCKLSGLLYGGFILVVLEVTHRFATGALSRPAGTSPGAWVARAAGAAARSAGVVAGVIAIGIVFAVAACGVSRQGVHPMTAVAQAAPENEPLRARYAELADRYDRFPLAGVAFAFQWAYNARGRPSFLNGTYYPTGYRFYFPVLMAMKIPVPVFMLGLLALARPRAAFNPLTAGAIVLTAVSLTANLQIGVRLVLPVVALWYAGIAVGVGRGFGLWGTRAGFIAVAVMAGTSAWVWPHGLGYLNQLAGGPSAAHWRVSDSNLDWGQGVPDLIAWHKANGEPQMAVWYFGTDPAAARPPFEQLFIEQSRISTANEFRAAVKPRLLAVGASVLTLHPFDPPPKAAAMKYLQTLEPVARTATFVIYDFRNSPEPPPGM